ncbi:hypothetical protein OHR68_09740 [Spirillospora sp. NBC_00431]
MKTSEILDLKAPIAIDLARLPEHTRAQAWWDTFVPFGWVVATVRCDGTVLLDAAVDYIRCDGKQIVGADVRVGRRSLVRWLAHGPESIRDAVDAAASEKATGR